MSSGKGLSVFIVEDQPLIKAGLVFMLEDLEGILVVGDASDGQDGVRQVLALRPDVTLMDISLPELDGISATKQIRQSWPEAKILQMTGHEVDDYVLAAFAAGAYGYCLKGANAEQFAEALSRVGNGKISLDRGIAERVFKSYFDHDEIKNEIVVSDKKTASLSAIELEVLHMLLKELDLWCQTGASQTN